MHAIPLNIRGELFANGSLGGIGGIGSAHHIAPLADSVFTLEHKHDYRPFGHELNKTAEEWPLAMDCVKRLRLGLRKALHLHPGDAKARLRDRRKYLARLTRGYGIRLDDGEGTFQLTHNLLCTLAPMSAGEAHTVMPAASMAAILSDALPEPPEIIAPACPIRRPGGAVCPAMNPTTGFFTLSLMY